MTDDFKTAYKNVAAESSPKLVCKDFAFRSTDTLGFFEPKSFSPDLTHLAARLGVNFKGCEYQTLEKPGQTSEVQAKSGVKLTAYLVPLLTLRVRTRELTVFEADKMILDEILMDTASGAAQATDLRREFALSALGVSKRDVPSLLVLGHLEVEAPSGIEGGVLPGLGTRFDAGQGSQGWRTLWFFLPAREVITEDAFVCPVVRDRFDIRLAEPFHIYPPALSALFRQHISAKIQLLLEKGAIERVRDHQHLCLSPIFMIPSARGSCG